MWMLITINKIMLVCCIFQGLGNQADSDNVAEILAYGKTFTKVKSTPPYVIEEVKAASHYEPLFLYSQVLFMVSLLCGLCN